MRIMKDGKQIGYAEQNPQTGVMCGRPTEQIVASSGMASFDMRTPMWPCNNGMYLWRSCLEPIMAESIMVEVVS